MRRAGAEHGGIVAGWLVRVVLGLALFAVLVFEGAAVIVATVGADDAARTAAQDGLSEFSRAHNVEAARREAAAAAERVGATLVGFAADTKGAGGQERVTATAEKPANTLFIHRIGFLKRFSRQRSSSTTYGV